MPTSSINRRFFLKGVAAANGLAVLGAPMLSVAATEILGANKLSDRLTLITGAGGNVVLYRGDAGLTLIDSGTREQAPALLKLVDELTGKTPIRTLFNTHWHEDHTGGNEAVHARGAKIIAHENTRLWLGADFDVEWRNTSHKPRLKAALPDQTFYTDGKQDLGGETVQYFYFPQAHTDGDVALYFPDSNVLVAGGLLSNNQYPIADSATGGWIGGLIAANAAMLAKVNDSTVIIADHGPARKKADLQAQHDMLNDLYEVMKTLEREGSNDRDMLKEKITAKYDARFGNPEEFIKETYRGMWAHTYDMGGFI
ncbi:MAG: MBL fold metallo-hydrolase [Gammaproteobacteria bacterium]|jgi:glyoxylase-like metal-dependent hydrolase (beta-lactamase superfamily II)